jgi:dinuclear metal center YbgI/SA1388 family protein
MTITVNTICQAMDAWAPQSLAYDWDKVGLQIGEPGQPVKRVLACLTVTAAAVAKAEQWGAGMIVAHHPILFSALKTLRTDDPHTRLCLRLAARNIACFAAHTNLDVVPGGVNTLLADTLCLQDIAPLIPSPRAEQVKLITFVPEIHLASLREALCRAGAGVIGDYAECTFSTSGIGTFRPGDDTKPFSGRKGALNEEAELRIETLVAKAVLPQVLQALRAAHPYEEPAFDIVLLENRDARFGLGARGTLAQPVNLRDFAQFVRNALKLSHVRIVGDPRRKVQRIAVCGGAGGGEIPALPRDIDVYVTGDLKYHEADAAQEHGLALIDASHDGTERNIANAIARHLKRAVPGLETKAFIEPEIFQAVGPMK